MFKSVLIANRGEIAVRIVRACRAMGVRAISVFSEADAGALHVRLADAAYPIEPAPAAQSYRDIARLIDVARLAGADAVHPGYGLLSEDPAFAEAVAEAGLAFIGPRPQTIAVMGDKTAARAAAARSAIPVLEGSERALTEAAEAADLAARIGYPVVVKPSFGGGGRGMRVVREPAGLAAALEQAAKEAQSVFGRPDIYLECYVERSRHVEVQVIADRHGGVLHLGDRDCSVQRRHQKLIEEAPAPGLAHALRGALRDAAVRLAREVSYEGAGTVEFLVDPSAGRFYFLEMNTRLQVEHGVTEMVTGVDLVQAQIRVAAGEPLGLSQQDVTLNGHAIEARIAAEDPWDDFRPRPGRIDDLRLPLGPWLRLDFGLERGDVVPPFYDSLFGKVMAWGPDRETARRRLAAALGELQVVGPPTTSPYVQAILGEPAFIACDHHTGSLEADWPPSKATRPASHAVPTPGEEKRDPPAGSWIERLVSLPTPRGPLRVAVFGRAPVHGAPAARAAIPGRASTASTSPASGRNDLVALAPMDGTVIRLDVAVGDRVRCGQTVAVLEAMKMELAVAAAADGVVAEIRVQPMAVVSAGAALVVLHRQAPEAAFD